MSYHFYRFLSYAAVLVLSSVSFLDAQTQASCTFKLFKPAEISLGVNDWGTTVGALNGKAAIRYAGGGISYFLPRGAREAVFVARNNSGVTVGQYADWSGKGGAFILKGSTVTPIEDPRNPDTTPGVSGINKWNSIVGSYGVNTSYGIRIRGFKRYSDGRFVDLDYPFDRVLGGQMTAPVAINDNGVVVGGYSENINVLEAIVHGFIYHNGQWATLDVSNTVSTTLVGISNAGAIVADASEIATGSGIASFLYVNGKFKTIKVPNATSTRVNRMSPGGLITGIATIGTAQYGFVGYCQ